MKNSLDIPCSAARDLSIARSVRAWGAVLRLCAVLLGSVAVVSQAAPNLLIVYVDDLGYGDTAVYGHPVVSTPNIDRLAAEGTRFSQFYAPSALCSPSRAGLLTGRTPYRTGVHSWIPDDSPVSLGRNETTLADLARAAGYRTAVIGKWHLNGGLHRQDAPQPRDFGFEYQYGLAAWVKNDAVDGQAQRPRRGALYPDNMYRNNVPVGPTEKYSAELVTAAARTPWELGMAGETAGLRGKKRYLFEGGIRVPGILRYPPRIAAGRVENTPATALDIFPTLAELLAVETDPGVPVDGESLWPLLEGDAFDRERPLYWSIPTPDGMEFALRAGDWKLILDAEGRPHYLFNLADDFYEVDDRLQAEPAVAARLETQFRALRASIEADPLAAARRAAAARQASAPPPPPKTDPE